MWDGLREIPVISDILAAFIRCELFGVVVELRLRRGVLDAVEYARFNEGKQEMSPPQYQLSTAADTSTLNCEDNLNFIATVGVRK